MAYSQAFAQAISILAYIASKIEDHGYEFVSTKQIAESLNIPVPTASKVLRSLTDAGLTVTKEGAKGGLLLGKHPADISVLEIFTALERNKPLFKVPPKANIEGEKVEKITANIMACLASAEEGMKKSLEGSTLKDLLS